MWKPASVLSLSDIFKTDLVCGIYRYTPPLSAPVEKVIHLIVHVLIPPEFLGSIPEIPRSCFARGGVRTVDFQLVFVLRDLPIHYFEAGSLTKFPGKLTLRPLSCLLSASILFAEEGALFFVSNVEQCGISLAVRETPTSMSHNGSKAHTKS